MTVDVIAEILSFIAILAALYAVVTCLELFDTLQRLQDRVRSFEAIHLSNLSYLNKRIDKQQARLVKLPKGSRKPPVNKTDENKTDEAGS